MHRDGADAIVSDLESINVRALDESSRHAWTDAIKQVRAEFDGADETDGWSTRSVTDWAEAHCDGEFSTFIAMP